jgi:hypothetical protein
MVSCIRILKRTASCAWSHARYLHANLILVDPCYNNSQTGYAAVKIKKGTLFFKYTFWRSASLKLLRKTDTFHENLIQYTAAKERNAVGEFHSLIPAQLIFPLQRTCSRVVPNACSHKR